MTDVYAVLWGDLRALRRRLWRVLASGIMSPVLYLIAFGWGLGRGTSMEGVEYLKFVIPGIVALTAMNASYNGAGTKLNVAKLYYRTWDEYMMSPMKVSSLVTGKALFGVVRGLINVTAITAGALLMASSLHIGPLFLLTLLVTCLTFAYMGVLAALLAKSHDDMSTFSSFVLLPMTFLGGTFFSVSDLPPVLKGIIRSLPLTNASQCLRAAALDWPFPWPSLAVIIVYGLVFFAGCIYVGRRASV